VQELLQQPGWEALRSHLEAMIKRKRISRDSLNENDPPEKFMAHKERASYMTGWIQGAEYLLNDVQASISEEPRLRDQIKEIEDELKQGKHKR